MVQRHRAFVRVRLTYVAGADEEQKVLPAGYQSGAEITDLTKLLSRLVKTPGLLAYFNPNADLVLRPDLLEELLRSSILPVQAWVNIRMFNLPEDWMLMDTVGMAQFDLPDLEDCFAGDAQEPGEVAPRLLSFAEHMVLADYGGSVLFGLKQTYRKFVCGTPREGGVGARNFQAPGAVGGMVARTDRGTAPTERS